MDLSSNGLENGNELKFSREQGFFDKSIGVKVLLALLFIVSLFMFLHFREVRVETFELGSIAPKFVVAQVDIDFYDEEATIILRQEATAMWAKFSVSAITLSGKLGSILRNFW